MVTTRELVTGVTRGFEAVGDRWGFEIIRLVAVGPQTFAGLGRSLHLTDVVLSARLKHLTTRGLLTREPNPQRAGSWLYSLTELSEDLWEVYVALWTWDRRWCPSPEAPSSSILIFHRDCANSVVPAFGCGGCGAIGVTGSDVGAEVDPAMRADMSSPAAKRIVRLAGRGWYDAATILGDAWSTALLAAALLGARRFADFRRELNGASTATLSEKISRFIEIGLLTRAPIPGSRRTEYRLTNAGRDFFPVFAMFEQWSRAGFDRNDRPGLTYTHTQCAQRLLPRYTCNACNHELRRDAIRMVSPGVVRQ